MNRPLNYKSKKRFLGLPLLHIVRERSSETRKAPVATGIIAIGPLAVGVVAIGGGAGGVLAIGPVSFGVFSIGGLAVGVIAAAGGIALSLGLALGVFAAGLYSYGIWGVHSGLFGERLQRIDIIGFLSDLIFGP